MIEFVAIHCRHARHKLRAQILLHLINLRDALKFHDIRAL